MFVIPHWCVILHWRVIITLQWSITHTCRIYCSSAFFDSGSWYIPNYLLCMGVWMYPLHKLVFQCRSNHNYPKPSVDRFSFQPPFCIGLLCAQVLGWNSDKIHANCMKSLFKRKVWRVKLAPKSPSWGEY